LSGRIAYNNLDVEFLLYSKRTFKRAMNGQGKLMKFVFPLILVIHAFAGGSLCKTKEQAAVLVHDAFHGGLLYKSNEQICVTNLLTDGLLCKTNALGPVCKQCFRTKHVLVFISKFLKLHEYQKFFEANPYKKNTMKEYFQEIGLHELINEFEIRARRAFPIMSFGKFPVYATMLSRVEKKFIGGRETVLMLLDQPNGSSSYVFVLDNEQPLDFFVSIECPLCSEPTFNPIHLYDCPSGWLHNICAHCAVNLLFHNLNACPWCRNSITRHRIDQLVDVNSLHVDIDFLLQTSGTATEHEKLSAYSKILEVANDARVSNGATKGVFSIADEKKTLIVMRF
jgi:hypothetical protein